MVKGFYEGSIDFLIHYFFKFHINANVNEMLKKIVEQAYKDATIMGAYNAKISKKDCILKAKSDKCKEEAIEYLVQEIKDFNCNIDHYRDWHNEVCNKLVDMYKDIKKNDKSLWTYGNSQKIVNMSIKYLLLVFSILCTIDKNHNIVLIAKQFEQIIEELDIPIDRYIIELLLTKGIITKNAEILKNCAWSEMDATKYNKIQEEYHGRFVNNTIIPLLRELNEWNNLRK